MSWYYADNGKQIGPVSDDEWNSLTTSGKITPETLVWQEGMGAWQPYSTTVPSAGMPAAMPGLGSVTCSFCHKPFPADEVISMDGRMVCGNCKPLAVQLVKEGVSLPGALNYAGFWIRFGAKIIDWIILGIVNFALTTIFSLLVRPGAGGEPSATALAGTLILVFFQLAVQAVYSIYFTGKMGGTPGKLACGLRVVRPDGSPLTFGRATGRFFAEMVNAFTLTIGYIIAGFDDQKRALHDRIADTRVVKK